METVKIKLFKPYGAGTLEDYGAAPLRALDKLVGGKSAWATPAHHGEAFIPGSKARVSRHEDGPEVTAVINQLPNIISALAAVISTWIAYKSYKALQKPPANDRKLIIEYKGHRYEGTPGSKAQAEAILNTFTKLK